MRNADFAPEACSLKQLPVQRAVLDRLQHIVRADVLRATEIGQGAGDLEDTVVGAGGEVHLAHGMLHVAVAHVVELAVLLHLARAHGGIGAGLASLEAALLDLAGLHHAGADGLRFLATAGGGKLAVLDQGDIHVEVDAVEQWAGDAAPVVLDLPGRAAALPPTISIVATGMRIPLGEIVGMKS